MNNIEKAIEWFKREIQYIKAAPALNGCKMTEEWKEQLEVCETALEALKDRRRENEKIS